MKPRSAVRILPIFTASKSPGSAPSTYTGPVSGCAHPQIDRQILRLRPGLQLAVSASSVSSSTNEPDAIRTAGAMSGCQRLCPFPAVWPTALCDRLRFVSCSFIVSDFRDSNFPFANNGRGQATDDIASTPPSSTNFAPSGAAPQKREGGDSPAFLHNQMVPPGARA